MNKPMTIQEAAELLGVKVRRIQQMASDGRFGSTRRPTYEERIRFGLRHNCLILRRSRVKAHARWMLEATDD